MNCQYRKCEVQLKEKVFIHAMSLLYPRKAYTPMHTSNFALAAHGGGYSIVAAKPGVYKVPNAGYPVLGINWTHLS